LIVAAFLAGKVAIGCACRGMSESGHDPVNAARFMIAASTLKRLARSVALNAPCAARRSRIGTPLGCLDIGSSPVQPRNQSDDSNQLAN
jgi:hypothetical protein